MALNIKNAEVEQGARGESFLRYLAEEVWPLARQAGVAGKRLSREQEDQILGYGRDGF